MAHFLLACCSFFAHTFADNCHFLIFTFNISIIYYCLVSFASSVSTSVTLIVQLWLLFSLTFSPWLLLFLYLNCLYHVTSCCLFCIKYFQACHLPCPSLATLSPAHALTITISWFQLYLLCHLSSLCSTVVCLFCTKSFQICNSFCPSLATPLHTLAYAHHCHFLIWTVCIMSPSVVCVFCCLSFFASFPNLSLFYPSQAALSPASAISPVWSLSNSLMTPVGFVSCCYEVVLVVLSPASAISSVWSFSNSLMTPIGYASGCYVEVLVVLPPSSAISSVWPLSNTNDSYRCC